MSSRRYCIYVVFLAGLLAFASAKAQISYSNSATTAYNQDDTVPPVTISEADLNRIVDARTLLRRKNRSFSKPVELSERLQYLLERSVEDTVSFLSEEALRLINPAREPSDVFGDNVTFRDTILVNPIFLPIIFKGKAAPGKLEIPDGKIAEELRFTPWLQPDTSIFESRIRKKQLEELAFKYIETNYPSLIRYSEKDIPTSRIILIPISAPVYEEVPIPVAPKAKVEDTEAPPKFIPDRLYWTSAFESAVQFSQNYVSPNWYKGGSSNLNIFTRNYLRYDYNRDKVQFANEAEVKATIYNAPNDTLHNYKIGDDLFRLHSSLGIKAFPKWYYSLDAEFKTQLFTNFQENKEVKQAALLSPFSINMGLGMKYDMEKAFKERGRKLKLSMNLAPLSFTYMKSLDTGIDLGRHGFKKKTESDEFNDQLTRLGSTVRMDMTMSFNRNVSWQSRIYYFTTYEFTQFEFENTLTLALSRHFSTIIYFHLRFDDSATKKPDYDSFFQLNERLSFGFNYKW